VAIVASSLDVKVVLGGVKKYLFFCLVEDTLDFGFFLKSHFKVKNRRSLVPKALQKIANVFRRQLLFMIIKIELTLN
jgi:hypothetical protein